MIFYNKFYIKFNFFFIKIFIKFLIQYDHILYFWDIIKAEIIISMDYIIKFK